MAGSVHEEIPPTRGVLTTLLPEEVAALGVMGLGVPLVLPSGFAEAAPAGLDTLRDHLLVDESGDPLPWFAAIWSCVVQPRVIGLVARTIGETEYAWLYYVRTGGFVEQVSGSDEVALLGGPLDELPHRLALAAGLLRYHPAEQQSTDPLLTETFAVSVRFTRVGGPTFSADFEVTPEGWEHAGHVIEPATVAAELERLLSAAFAAEPTPDDGGEERSG